MLSRFTQTGFAETVDEVFYLYRVIFDTFQLDTFQNHHVLDSAERLPEFFPWLVVRVGNERVIGLPGWKFYHDDTLWLPVPCDDVNRAAPAKILTAMAKHILRRFFLIGFVGCGIFRLGIVNGGIQYHVNRHLALSPIYSEWWFCQKSRRGSIRLR